MADPALVYHRLSTRLGVQGWWPAETRFEVIVGALLMAQTAWRNVEESVGNLKRAGTLDPVALASIPLTRLRTLVKPAGLYRTKPRRLRAFCQHLVRVASGDLDRFFGRDPGLVRSELLGLDGVGPETADSILLYAGSVPTFVVDAYTVRIGCRVGLFDTDRYDDVKAYFEANLPRELGLFREFHALFVALGKEICRPRPRCSACPLNDVCAFARNRERVEGRTNVRTTFKYS